MNRFTLLLLFTGISLWACGQKLSNRNALYLEAGGNGLFASLNYDRQLTKNPGPGIRVGLGFYSEDAFYLTIPVSLYYLFPLKKEGSFLEAGAGCTWVRKDAIIFTKAQSSNDNFTCFVPSFGYRKQTKKQTVWRVMVTPVASKYSLLPWLGCSIGKMF
jgi:hypothetical protein